MNAPTINPAEVPFLRALSATKEGGNKRKTRNGYTTAIFAHQMRFDLRQGFPAVTTKELVERSVSAELLWFLDGGKETKGRMSLDKLNQIQGKSQGSKNIWTKDQARFASQGKARFDGDCGRIYGAQWRSWKKFVLVEGHNEGSVWVPDEYKIEYVDQIAKLIQQLKEDPFSRYHIVNAWNPAEIDDMCLPPCHMFFQCFVREVNGQKYLDLHMTQRSCDMFLGVPFNIASYALLTHMIAQCVDMTPGELVITLNDCHIYTGALGEHGEEVTTRGHMEQVDIQLSNEMMPAPTLWLNPAIKNIDEFTMQDIRLDGYEHNGRIPAEML